MDWYEKELLARTVEAAHRRGEWIDFFPKGWDKAREGDVFMVGMYSSGPVGTDPEKFMRDAWTGEALADALTALLTDLGEPVPERPSAERVKEARDHFIDDVAVNGANYPHAILDSLASLYAREPLTVLALIEGGEA